MTIIIIPNHPKFYTILEMAKILQVSESTIRREIKGGYLKSIKVGGSVRIPRTAIDEYLKNEV